MNEQSMKAMQKPGTLRLTRWRNSLSSGCLAPLHCLLYYLELKQQQRLYARELASQKAAAVAAAAAAEAEAAAEATAAENSS